MISVMRIFVCAEAENTESSQASSRAVMIEEHRVNFISVACLSQSGPGTRPQAGVFIDVLFSAVFSGTGALYQRRYGFNSFLSAWAFFSFSRSCSRFSHACRALSF